MDTAAKTPSDPGKVGGIDPQIFNRLDLPDLAKEYLNNRWLHEVGWFARATQRSRRVYFWLSGLSIVASSLTALLAVAVNSNDEKYRWIIALLVSLLALVSALSTGFLALFQGWANWKRRSTTLERLKSEGRHFLVRAGAYKAYSSDQAAFEAFVPKIEAIISEHKTGFFAKSPDAKSETNPKSDAPLTI